MNMKNRLAPRFRRCSNAGSSWKSAWVCRNLTIQFSICVKKIYFISMFYIGLVSFSRPDKRELLEDELRSIELRLRMATNA